MLEYPARRGVELLADQLISELIILVGPTISDASACTHLLHICRPLCKFTSNYTASDLTNASSVVIHAFTLGRAESLENTVLPPNMVDVDENKTSSLCLVVLTETRLPLA